MGRPPPPVLDKGAGEKPKGIKSPSQPFQVKDQEADDAELYREEQGGIRAAFKEWGRK